ncbi:hypothetical protein V6N13_096089 [Hibiscus sabdariffa]
MALNKFLVLFLIHIALLWNSCFAEDPFVFYNFEISYITASPLGVPQQVIAINNKMDYGEWSENSRGTYNKWDGIARSTTQVYPGAWTAILISLDNVGVWNLRTENLDSWPQDVSSATSITGSRSKLFITVLMLAAVLLPFR